MKWKQGDIIRDKQTGAPYLVLFTHWNVGSIICDMTDPSPIPLVLFERDYPEFAKDCDMRENNAIWEYEAQPSFL